MGGELDLHSAIPVSERLIIASRTRAVTVATVFVAVMVLSGLAAGWLDGSNVVPIAATAIGGLTWFGTFGGHL